MTHLSVLDLIPARSRQTTGEAVAASLSLARTADDLGFTRYWVAEHHNAPAIASTSPSTLIAHFAAHTNRIRLGSGGVMLPNHAPLSVAEQFALLEALHPGRIDLGLGRASGSDPVSAHMLRSPRGAYGSQGETFPSDVRLVTTLLGSDRTATNEPFGDDQPGARLDIDGKSFQLKASPRLATAPEVWLLGSSNFSADLAATLGMPFVYANHFGQTGIEEALDLYRSRFQPSDAVHAPKTFVTASISVDQTAEEARIVALPQLIMIARSRSPRPLDAQLTIDEALRADLTPSERQTVAEMSERWLIGTPPEVEQRIRALTTQYGADEVMVLPVGGAYAADPMGTTPSRERALRLLAGRFPELS
ncbi:LLM class flavin-dependent oxidoreductase [Rhodococcus erythropolis]|uniref:LLM class flavin-dependent oxidoreductase n=1 Tax=Rhodococcus erythropolis TaxID=1833 RepID=UPI0038730427